MPRIIRKHREYRFEIDAFSPETIPMARLAQYLTDLATLLGQTDNVHLVKIEKGSTVPVIQVEWEAEPKVRERVKLVKLKEAPQEAMRAAREIDKRLLEDNARGSLLDPVGSKVLRFAGRDLLRKPTFGPINQPGFFQGVPIKIGGERDPVPVHLEDGETIHIAYAKRTLAKELAQYLFTAAVRIVGDGRWVRDAEGEWEMLSFTATGYRLIEDADIRKDIEELRNIDAAWKKQDDQISLLQQIRRGTKTQ
jgi:hypothetical protein